MGDPKKIRKKYSTPMHPWIGSRIEEERAFRKEYGLGNKKEIWKMMSQLTDFKDRAKKLIARQDAQGEKEREQLLARMARLGLIQKDASFDDILGMSVRNVMERRLQSILVRKHLARTHKQARQMITHRHVLINGQVVTSPGHIITLDEESTIAFAPRSAFANESHPERLSEEEISQKRAKEEDKKKKIVKAEEEVPAYDEKAIEEAEVLAGEKKAEKKKDIIQDPAAPTETPKTKEKTSEPKKKPTDPKKDEKPTKPEEKTSEPKKKPAEPKKSEKKDDKPAKPKTDAKKSEKSPEKPKGGEE